VSGEDHNAYQGRNRHWDFES